MNDPTKPTGRHGLPWLRIVLVVSLALNLLVVGMVAGAWLRHDRSDAVRHGSLRDLGYGPFGEALSVEDRRDLARDLTGKARDLQANRSRIRQEFQAMLDALRTSPFDAETFEAVTTRQQERLAERQAIGRRVLLDRIEAMTDAERSVYADRLERSLRRTVRDRR